MPKFILIIFFTIIATASVFSQVAPPAINGWKEFLAEDNSYAVLLPELTKDQEAGVARVNSLVKNWLGGNDVYVKASYLGNTAFCVSFQDFSSPLTDDLEKEAQFELIEDALGEKTGNVFASKITDIDFAVDPAKKSITNENQEKFAGIQTVLETNDFYIFSRLFFAKQRLFRLMAVVPRNETESSRDNFLRFFSSFKIGQIPPAKFAATPLPPQDFQIFLNGQTLQSKQLNLTFQFPKEWKIEVFDPEKQKLTPAEQKEYERQKAQLRWLWRNRQGFGWATSGSNRSNIGLIINRRPLANSTLENFVSEREKFYGAKQAKIEINSNRFLVLEREHKKHYYTNWNEYFLEIYIEYENETDLKLLENLLTSLKALK